MREPDNRLYHCADPVSRGGRLLRVAAYCRVSTDSRDQANSLESQQSYFSGYIARNPEWELARVFVDRGITGTSTRKRAAFHHMIEEAMAGNIDLIITKEISRFARNTLDSIYYTRKLKECGVGVIFLNDGINTLDPDAELRLTIMASIAQEESRKTSERVRWGQKRRMEQGVVFGRDMLGYDVRDGRLYVNEEGAEVVRLIFHKFVNEGKGTHVIARELQEAGVRTSTYMKQWSNTVILRILRNEKVVGDLVQKKTITPSYLTHEKKPNRGEEELIVIRDHHEPIISRELFDRAQEELARRSPRREQRARHSNRYCFSGKIKCGVCGCSFVSRTKKRSSGSVYKSWRCRQAAAYGAARTDESGEQTGCDCPSVGEEALKLVMRSIVQSLPVDRTGLVGTVEAAVIGIPEAREDENAALDEKLDALAAKRQKLVELFLAQDISKDDFRQIKEKYDRETDLLRRQKERREQGVPVKESKDTAGEELHEFLTGLAEGRIWDDVFYRNLLEKMTVARDGGITVSLSHVPVTWRAVPRG